VKLPIGIMVINHKHNFRIHIIHNCSIFFKILNHHLLLRRVYPVTRTISSHHQFSNHIYLMTEFSNLIHLLITSTFPFTMSSNLIFGFTKGIFHYRFCSTTALSNDFRILFISFLPSESTFMIVPTMIFSL